MSASTSPSHGCGTIAWLLSGQPSSPCQTSGRSYLAAQGYGGTKIQLALDDVTNITMPMPPLDEQQDDCAIS